MPVVAAIAAAPAAAKAVKKAVASIPVLGSALQQSDPEKDRNRNQATDAAFNRAVGGDVNAIAYVRARGAKVPAVNIPGYGYTGNWGSAVSTAYARTKYLQLEAMPALASEITRAKALWTAQGAPPNTVGETLTRPVGGVPVWLIVVGVVALALLAWRWLK